MKKLLITGSEGLVGTALASALERRGHTIERLDLRAAEPTARGDVRDPDACHARAQDCVGIIHLAAVSRVVWGERDPEGCWQTNVNGTRNILEAAKSAGSRPWILLASSREVYGHPARIPVRENDPIRPINIYGRSKADGERLVQEAREFGLRTAIVRLSNVYGSYNDHPDRVVPAFARAAATGTAMEICGRDHTFDFTHIDDTVRGLLALIDGLDDGLERPPPIQLVTGRATTLGRLAELANAAGGSRSRLEAGPERDYDVAHFVGDPSRARELLNWQAQIPIEVGVRRLVGSLREAAGPIASSSKDSRAVAPRTAAVMLGPASA